MLNRFLGWLTLWRRLPTPLPLVAVFIDGDGVSPKDAERAIEWVQRLGRVTVLRAYGNYTGRAANAWTNLIRRRSIVARHMPSLTAGKNAADIALTIDAIELLLNRQIDIFVLIVSDTDFVPLARRITEEGKEVLGFGQRSTPENFRLACSEFREIRSLDQQVVTDTPHAKHWSLSPGDAEAIVLPILRAMVGNGEPIALSLLGSRLIEHDPGFDARIYNRRSLTDLLNALPSVELINRDGTTYARPIILQERTG